MPIEYLQLKDKPQPFQHCPKCHRPFIEFLRGMVQRSKRWLCFGPKRDYCAVICYNCKQIVGWESP